MATTWCGEKRLANERLAHAVHNVFPRKFLFKSTLLLQASRRQQARRSLAKKASPIPSHNHLDIQHIHPQTKFCIRADNVQKNYVDRNAIAQARLNNLERDLGMTGVQFNTTVSILFVGYVLMQVPSNMLITRIKPGIYMSAWMLVWAVVSGCTALVQSFGGLVACRFFLGITEAPFYPGATYMLSIFYTRKGMCVRERG